MYTFKSIIRLLVLLSVVSFPMKPAEATTMLDNNNGPELPPACSTITAPEGHKLAFHVYAKGVQVYRFNGVSWDFVAPVAARCAAREPCFAMGSGCPDGCL